MKGHLETLRKYSNGNFFIIKYKNNFHTKFHASQPIFRTFFQSAYDTSSTAFSNADNACFVDENCTPLNWLFFIFGHKKKLHGAKLEMQGVTSMI